MRTDVSDFQAKVARELLLYRRVVLLHVVARSVVLNISLVRQTGSTTVHYTLHRCSWERSGRRLGRGEVLLIRTNLR